MRKDMYVLAALALIAFAVLGQAKIYVSNATNCMTMYPGDSVTKAVTISVDKSGWYTVVASGTINITPAEQSVYVEAGVPRTVFFTINAPADVTDDYFYATFTLYDVNQQYVDSQTMCIHVSRYGEAAASVTDFVFGAKQYYEDHGYMVVPLYVENTGSVPVSVDFTSDFQDVIFTETSVNVEPGRTVTILAKIPASDQIPAAVTFYAYGNGIRKTVVVRFPNAVATPALEIQVPNEVTIENGTTFVPVKVINTGNTAIEVKPVLKNAPFGVASYSDYKKVYPKQETVFNMIVTAQGVLSTGTKVAQVCLVDKAEVPQACRYIVLKLPGAQTKEVNTTVVNGQVEATITVSAGAKAYDNVIVQVTAPEGWQYKVEPADVLNIPAYSTETVKVYFKPTDNAQAGTASIVLKTPDGTIIAQKTVPLSPSNVTGYAVLGGNSAAWIVVGIIVLAVLFALFSKGGKGSNGELEEIKAEITKR